MKRTLTLPIIAMCLAMVGCSPQAMQAVADGLAGYNSAEYGGSQSSASSETVCVKYETEYGWSKGYQVTGTVIKGTELNSRTGTYNYSPYSTYVVVFWDEDQASILELDFYSGSISTYGQSATDQRGRSWQVSQTSYCY